MLVSVWALCDVRNINIVNVLFNFVESKVIYVRKFSGGVGHIPSFSQNTSKLDFNSQPRDTL